MNKEWKGSQRSFLIHSSTLLRRTRLTLATGAKYRWCRFRITRACGVPCTTLTLKVGLVLCRWEAAAVQPDRLAFSLIYFSDIILFVTPGLIVRGAGGKDQDHLILTSSILYVCAMHTGLLASLDKAWQLSICIYLSILLVNADICWRETTASTGIKDVANGRAITCLMHSLSGNSEVRGYTTPNRHCHYSLPLPYTSCSLTRRSSTLG